MSQCFAVRKSVPCKSQNKSLTQLFGLLHVQNIYTLQVFLPPGHLYCCGEKIVKSINKILKKIAFLKLLIFTDAPPLILCIMLVGATVAIIVGNVLSIVLFLLRFCLWLNFNWTKELLTKRLKCLFNLQLRYV